MNTMSGTGTRHVHHGLVQARAIIIMSSTSTYHYYHVWHTRTIIIMFDTGTWGHIIDIMPGTGTHFFYYVWYRRTSFLKLTSPYKGIVITS